MGKRFGYLLIVGVLLIEVPRFAAAFSALDDPVFGMPLTALGTAFVLSGGSMYVFHTWWTSTRKLRNWLLVPFGVNLALAALILVPWGSARLHGVSLASVAPWWWVPASVLSPFVLAGGVTTALAFQKETRKRSEQVEQKPKKAEPVPELSGSELAVVRAYRNGAGSYQQVADAVGMGKTTVGARVNGLIERGVLERTAQGVVVRVGDNGNL